jgi:glutathione S-transferase
MQDFVWTALVTMLALVVYFVMSLAVGRARGKYQVVAPATTGDPNFERQFRVQMNTLEWLPIFLPSLWLAALYWGDTFAATLGAIWVIGRVLYMVGYARSTQARAPGFLIQGLSALALLIGALIGAAQAALAAFG